MEKPITVQIKEIKEQIIKVLNESRVHVAIMKPIIDDIKMEVDRQYQMVEEQEAEQYKKDKAQPKEKGGEK